MKKTLTFDQFIDRTFARLKKEIKILLKSCPFEIFHNNENIVEKLILNLNATSSPGFSEIPSKVI